MKPTAEIAKPIDEFEIEGGQRITIWPWFDLKGESEKLDRLWADYRTARGNSGIEDGFPSKVDPIEYIKRFGCPPESLLGICASLDQYDTQERKIRKSCPVLVWNKSNEFFINDEYYPIRLKYKALGVAHRALQKALARHYGVNGVYTPFYYEYDDPQYVRYNKWWRDAEIENDLRNEMALKVCHECREARRLNKDSEPLCWKISNG